jgi:hypothetical protein
MTREDILRMAREAGYGFSMADLHAPALERFAELVAAAEREACAKLCDQKIDAEYATGKVDHNEMAWTQACAIAIRARGEELSSKDNLSKSPTDRGYTCPVCNRQEMVRAKFDEESG